MVVTFYYQHSSQSLALVTDNKHAILPTTVITGASSGIGLELARIFAENGHNLILAARSIRILEELADDLAERHNISAIPVRCDFLDPAAPEELYKTAQSNGFAVDCLVNNAGFGAGGEFSSVPLERHMELLTVNVKALTELTWRFLPDMIVRKKGRILNVASTAAFQPGPFLAVYYASKAYVLSFSEAIDEELRDTGVSVTALCPGPTHTKFSEVADLNRSRLFNSPLTMNAADVARYGYNSMMKGRRVAIPGVVNKAVAFGNRLVPRKLATTIARKLQEG